MHIFLKCSIFNKSISQTFRDNCVVVPYEILQYSQYCDCCVQIGYNFCSVFHWTAVETCMLKIYFDIHTTTSNVIFFPITMWWLQSHDCLLPTQLKKICKPIQPYSGSIVLHGTHNWMPRGNKMCGNRPYFAPC